jgi:IS30 family transposase
MNKTYKRLTLNERIIIETLLHEKKSKSYMAIHLNRSRSTINNELKKWLIKPTDTYSATLAHWYATTINSTKRTEDKINTYKSLLSGYSPDQIAGSIKLLYLIIQ